MSRRPPRPASPVLSALPWVAAGAVFLLAFGALRALRPEPAALGEALAAGPVVTRHAAAVERSWIDDAFAPSYLPAPPGEPPCPEGLRTVPPSDRRRVAAALASDAPVRELEALASRSPGSWLPVLALSHALLRDDRANLALPLLERHLARPAFVRTVGQAVSAARAGRPAAAPASEEVLASIHLLHADGYARILENRTGGELWRSLRNPIGCAKLLALRGEVGAFAGAPTARELLLPAPGCPPSAQSLSSYDLYGNLIVGYLETEDFEATKEWRSEELERPYRDAPHENPLQAVLEQVQQEWEPAREHWVFALSNAERVLRERGWEGGAAPPDARLALNLAQLAESALPLAPEAAAPALAAQVSELVETARRRRDEIAAPRRAAFDPLLARMVLVDAVRRGKAPELPEALLGQLDEAEATAARAVAAALVLREAPGEWLDVVRAGDPEAVAALGAGRGAWLAASRWDLAATTALRGRGAEEEERREWARRARSLLAWGDRPAELAEIEEGLGLLWRLSPTMLLTRLPVALTVAGLAALIAWAAAWLLALQLRRRKSLFTSFYRMEAERQLREGL